MQGGPLDNIVAAKAIAFSEAQSEEFKSKQIQIVKNSQALAKTLSDEGIIVITGGTDTHLMLLDCRSVNLTGKVAVNLLAEANIYTNFNMIPYDPATPFNPSGMRIGTPALTTRGMKEDEMKTIGGWIAQIFKNPSDEKLRIKIKEQVKELTLGFPIYENFKI
jgi:glycine hydroxymethyltransferase